MHSQGCFPVYQDSDIPEKSVVALLLLGQKVTFIFYHPPPLKIFLFVSYFSLAQFLNSPSLL